MKRIEEKLTAIGDAIREKTGGTELLSLDEMPSEIASIETGIKTDDATAVAGDILSGKTAYAKDVKITGTIPTKTQGDLTVNEATVTVPSGYYNSQVSKSVTTTTQAVPSISINNNGLITAFTTQTAGYVTAGTESATKQLTTKAAATITPSTSNQTIAAGTYLTGTQTIAGDADLVASNIKKGINIFNVYGSYEGVELNFEVVGGTTQPSSASENTIWVNTSTAITSWIFSATQPTSPSAGMVWIRTGSSSSVDFNALKNNTLKVYPMSAKQYIGGTWIGTTMKLYQGGAWESTWDGYVYNTGDECFDVTGGWETAYKSGLESNLKGTLTKNADHLYLEADAYKEQVWAKTVRKVNITGRSRLEIEVISFTSSSYNPTRKFGISDGSSWDGDSNMIASASITGNGTFTLDLSAVSAGEYYICLFDLGVYSKYGVTKVRLS